MSRPMRGKSDPFPYICATLIICTIRCWCYTPNLDKMSILPTLLYPRKSALGVREGCLMKTSRWLERKYGYRSKLRCFRIGVTATKTFDGKGGIKFGFH